MDLTTKILFQSCLAVLIVACNTSEPALLKADQAKLISLHDQGREAHFKKNALALVEQFLMT